MKVVVTADIDVPLGTPSLVRCYRASPEPVLAPRAHIDIIVAAGRGHVFNDEPPAAPPPAAKRSRRR
jgi:hypothetical protein